jgi:hypothetical protein
MPQILTPDPRRAAVYGERERQQDRAAARDAPERDRRRSETLERERREDREQREAELHHDQRGDAAADFAASGWGRREHPGRLPGGIGIAL